eukprot:scaffold93715_cov78-Attheya_sp.AAC.3
MYPTNGQYQVMKNLCIGDFCRVRRTDAAAAAAVNRITIQLVDEEESHWDFSNPQKQEGHGDVLVVNSFLDWRK